MKKISGMKKLRLKGAKIKTEPVKTKAKKSPIANLGHYAHEAKLPSGVKIGKSPGAKTTKKKVLKMRAQKGAHLNV